MENGRKQNHRRQKKWLYHDFRPADLPTRLLQLGYTGRTVDDYSKSRNQTDGCVSTSTHTSAVDSMDQKLCLTLPGQTGIRLLPHAEQYMLTLPRFRRRQRVVYIASPLKETCEIRNGVYVGKYQLRKLFDIGADYTEKQGWLRTSRHNHFNDFVVHPDNQALIREMCAKAMDALNDIRKEAQMEGRTAFWILRDQAATDTMDKSVQFKTNCIMDVPACDRSYPYRSADGSCNNFNHPTWGMAMTPEPRLLAPAYDDGYDLPRTLSEDRFRKLPSARVVSNIVHKGEQSLEDTKLSQWVMQWGQFLDHDVVLTPLTEGSMGGGALECCNGDGCLSECFPIRIPEDDPFFNGTCMNFVRSAPAMDFFQCKHGPRQQMNGITSAIDGSNVYGSSQASQDGLRTHEGGRLKTGPPNGEHLPVNPDQTVCRKSVPSDHCQLAGDGRSNVVPSLGTAHTLFVLFHNRVVERLAAVNSGWDDEKLFQEGRRIVAAIMQHITYNEYLPVVLGPDVMGDFTLTPSSSGYSDQYDPNVNLATVNSFGAASFRFGHSQVSNIQGNREEDFSDNDMRDVEETYHNPNMVLQDDGVDGISRWLATDASLKTDRVLDKGVRDLLFLTEDGVSLDLAALNIQRGRDHGLPGYNKWREFCNLSTATHFGTSAGGLVDHTDEAASLLEEAYEDPDDIDIFTAGVSEHHIAGGAVGPTFACMLATQFKAYKLGDRFWYERSDDSLTAFTAGQLSDIREMTLAGVICQSTGMDSMYEHAMLLPGNSNQKRDCADLPKFLAEGNWQY
ncbi:hypothetical protein ScPMuIL_003619 [Solemya velum]